MACTSLHVGGQNIEECRCTGRGVDGALQEHEAPCEHISCKSDNLVSMHGKGFHADHVSENGVTIDSSMLKVDPSCTIHTNNDLKLLAHHRESVTQSWQNST